MKVKAEDIIICKYLWGDEAREGIGYVYEVVNGCFYVALSCKDGGCQNEPIENVFDIQVVKEIIT